MAADKLHFIILRYTVEGVIDLIRNENYALKKLSELHGPAVI